MNGDAFARDASGLSVSTKQSEPDLVFVTLIHQALRADGPRMQATVANLQRDDPDARLAAVRGYFDRYREQLVAHHTHEDELFFPALASRVGADRMHRDELVSQHGELDGVLQEIGDALAAMAEPAGDFSANRTRATGALSTMVDHLTTHLDLEERTALPLVVSDMPATEYAELESKARKATPREQSAFMIPWLAAHASPEQRKAWFRTAPPLRIVELVNRGRYRRLEASLLPAA
jgi:hemerythrin-like domain-containing protein